MSKSKEKELSTENKTSLAKPNQKNANSLLPQSIFENYTVEVETFPFLIPVIGIPVAIKFVDGLVTTMRVRQDNMLVTKVFDLEDGEIKLLVMKAVLLKHFEAKGVETLESGEKLLSVKDQSYIIETSEQIKTKAGDKSYSPYKIAKLVPKEV